jgi:hypothetical protein
MMAPVLLLAIEPVSGLNSAIKTNKVRITTIWAITLFSFFIPLNISKRITPAKTGIKAVTEGVSEPKYPKRPTMIKIDAFIALIRYGFMTS